MGYVDRNLIPGEQVIYKARIHWFIFAPGLALLVAGIVFLGADLHAGSKPVIGPVIALLAAFSLIKALVAKTSTELVVTSKRIIAKMGLIGRSTIELNHSKVESLNVHQSILGRLLGFGTVVVNGTGGGKTHVAGIDSPFEFRRTALERLDTRQSLQA